MELKSVMSIPNEYVACQCLAKIRNYRLPIKEDEGTVVLGRMMLAEYYYNLLKKNGKLRDGVSEEELKFRMQDLKDAQMAAFKG